LADSTTVLPCISAGSEVGSAIPPVLRHINVLRLDGEGALERLVSLVLENLHLLRAERRLFISYRRAEAQSGCHPTL
jgi:hypothetical protein